MVSEDDTAYKQLFSHPEMVRDLLLEFQSRSDPWMALRMQVYIGLLYQDLINHGGLPQPDRLPPVFPAVLYSGKRRWRARMNLSELIVPVADGLESLQAFPTLSTH
jgi:hypothetical protein